MRNSTSTEVAVGADQVVSAERGFFYGATVTTDGVNAADLTVWDGAAANNKVVAHIKVVGANLYGGVILEASRRYGTLNYTLTGTGAKAVIYLGNS